MKFTVGIAGVLGACILLGSVACSSRAPEASALEPPIGAISVPQRPEDVKRPIDAYRPSRDTVIRVGRAWTRSVNECLIARGEPGGVAPSFEEAVPDFLVRDARFSPLWGVFEAPGVVPNAGQGALVAAMGSNGAEAYRECTTSADAQMPGSRFWISLTALSSLPDGGPPVPRADSRVLQATTDWRECLRRKGFAHTEGPTEFGLKKTAQGQDPDAVLADAECKRETNLVGRLLAVQTAYDEQYIESHAGSLAEFRKSIDEFLRNHPA